MKKRTYAIEIAVILSVFVLPPLIFVRESLSVFKPVYGASTFVFFVCAVILSGYVKKGRVEGVGRVEAGKLMEDSVGCDERSGTNVPGGNGRRLFLYPQAFLLSFGSLWVISSAVRIASGLAGWENEVTVTAPQGLFEWVNCVAGTMAAAFYEEVIYRQFLADRLEKVFDGGRCGRRLWGRFLWEGALVMLFAVSHLYAGWGAALNAFFAAIVLRAAYLKSGSVVLVALSHGLYNLLSILLMIYG